MSDKAKSPNVVALGACAVKVKALLGLQGVDWIKWRQPCKSWLYVTYWGISTKVTTVWIVPSGSRCSILDFVLAVVVTLGRCERCWSGALSRNSHRGSINLWCPADKRPTDRLGAVTLGNIQSGFLAALGWIFAKRSLTHSWVRLSLSHPRRAVNRWATTQCPLRLAAMQLWVELCQLSALLEW